MKLNNKILIAAGVAVLLFFVGVGAFAAGASYGNAQAQNVRAEFFQNRSGQQGQSGNNDGTQGGQGQRGQFGRVAAAGTVKSVQGNKIEVTTQNNSTVTVTVDSQTQLMKTVSAAIADIQPGMRVTVISDQTGSSVTARLITIQQPTSQ